MWHLTKLPAQPKFGARNCFDAKLISLGVNKVYAEWTLSTIANELLIVFV